MTLPRQSEMCRECGQRRKSPVKDQGAAHRFQRPPVQKLGFRTEHHLKGSAGCVRYATAQQRGKQEMDVYVFAANSNKRRADHALALLTFESRSTELNVPSRRWRSSADCTRTRDDPQGGPQNLIQTIWGGCVELSSRESKGPRLFWRDDARGLGKKSRHAKRPAGTELRPRTGCRAKAEARLPGIHRGSNTTPLVRHKPTHLDAFRSAGVYSQ